VSVPRSEPRTSGIRYSGLCDNPLVLRKLRVSIELHVNYKSCWINVNHNLHSPDRFNIYRSVCLWLYSPPLFSFLIYAQSVGLLGRWISPSQGSYLHRTTQTQTSMPRVGFEPTTPLFERAKTLHALDRAATVIGNLI
jgi:hypothetical protein